MTIRHLLHAAGALLVASSAAADTLLTRDGRIVDGPRMERLAEHVAIHFENGVVEVPDAMVESALIEGEAEFEPRTEEEKEMAAQGKVPYDGEWVSPKQREKLIGERLERQRRIVEEAKAHSTWGSRYQEESANFRWAFTVPRHIWDGYVKRVEAYYEIFSKEWRVKRDRRKSKLMINFFADRKEFQRTAGAGGGALAYFMFLGDYDLCAYNDRLDPASTEMVLYHELSHYMQKLLNEGFRMPHWPGEGLAEYYGGALWSDEDQELRIGLVQEGRLTEVQNDILRGTWVPFEKVVTEDAYTDYTWGWTLVHFFMNSKTHKKGFQKYVVGLANDKAVSRQVGAFNLRFVSPEESFRYLKDCLRLRKDEEVLALQQEWYDYIQEELTVTSATGLEQAAVAANRQGMRKTAERLFQEALDAGSTSAQCHYQFAKLLRGKDAARAETLMRRACELDPLTGSYWYELGRLVEPKDEPEGKRLKALAKELDPEVDFYATDIEITLEGDF